MRNERSEVDREPDNHRNVQPERDSTLVEVEVSPVEVELSMFEYVNPAADATDTSAETADEDQSRSSITENETDSTIPSLPPPTYDEVVASFNF